MAQDSRPCKGCGELIYRTVAVAPIRHYCSPDCRPRCSIEGCEKVRHGNVYCSAHHSRWKLTGDPLTPLTRHPNVGVCGVEGCDQPMRKTGWCASHYTQWHTTGEVTPFKFKWGTRAGGCLVCGAACESRGRRAYCSSRCAVRAGKYGADIIPSLSCVRCGVAIDLKITSKRKVRDDVKLCHRCKVHHRTESTPGELAATEGPYCQLCGCDVDMLAVHPDKMRPSVDHIIPRAWGGSDASENNQLSHLLCNQIKSDRYLSVSSRSR